MLVAIPTTNDTGIARSVLDRKVVKENICSPSNSKGLNHGCLHKPRSIQEFATHDTMQGFQVLIQIQ